MLFFMTMSLIECRNIKPKAELSTPEVYIDTYIFLFKYNLNDLLKNSP